MDFSGEERITAPRDVVWACLNDPALLKSCIPGCETLEFTSADELDAAIRIKLGPLSARFKGKVTLSDIDAPRHYRIAAEGKGGLAGFAAGFADIDLLSEGQETIMRYRAQAELGGRLLKLGSRLVDSTSQAFAERFFSDLNAAITARAGA